MARPVTNEDVEKIWDEAFGALLFNMVTDRFGKDMYFSQRRLATLAAIRAILETREEVINDGNLSTQT